MKLFLEQFGIRSTVLNSELPINSRIHIVQQFSQGVYDILIASDEHEVLGGEDEQEEAEEQKDGDSKEEKSSNPPKKKRRSAKRDKEYGVSRGIDFKGVAAVVNFDLPTSSKS